MDSTNKYAELKVYMDASQCALGGVLLKNVEGNLRPITYYSHKNNLSEVKYSTTKCKLLIIIDYLHFFHHSLLGS